MTGSTLKSSEAGAGKSMVIGSSWLKSLNPEATGFPYLPSRLSRKQQQQSFKCAIRAPCLQVPLVYCWTPKNLGGADEP